MSEHLASEKRKDSLKIFEARTHRCEKTEKQEGGVTW